MSVSVENIYEKTKEKYKLKLLAGNAGISNVISWIYIMEDITTADFIRGSELIITTGLGIKSESDLTDMIWILIHQKASGIIINTGNYIQSIPQAATELCNQTGFPLFVMPWETHLVDVTQEYCNWIICDKQNQLNISECFHNILFQPQKADYSLVKKMDYDINGLFQITIVSIPIALARMEQDEIKLFFEINFLSKLKKYVQRLSSVIFENKVLIIKQLLSRHCNISECINKVIKENCLLSEIRIGIGSVNEGIYNLTKGYKHALAAYDLAEKKNKNMILYDEMRAYKILTEVEDKEVLEKIFWEYLGEIVEYDNLHNSKYLDTLELYLEYNSSIQLVAEKSFTHRNTINYRMKKIRELLACDLDNTKDRFMLQLCYYINDIQNVSENKM
ncbi:DNA-binding PucR family transcriptional regulator [Lachnotalea glycerini]|uniref:PucR family transcriptional regulator n=1 Tax=Lachnotalea glycerini TaxID=1763509 RepID=A0A255IDP0_9FIRM|nr:PucR family transcriptional regulator [Lachnotalea glycerini]PXV96164.1 DNA-binding PucR family transcriptional regulator [Lachnotalea glycerini]RDY27502.1 PucR family transcriptional regulator [Lachnotalea glycerini]